MYVKYVLYAFLWDPMKRQPGPYLVPKVVGFNYSVIYI